MAVIGCDIPVVVSGTESLAGKTGVWTKTHLRQEGNYLVATTYLVAAGSPTVFEMRIDLRPLEKIAERVHAALHAKMAASPAVGFSFSGAWKSIKKTAKKIGKTKLVKAVSGAVSAVTKNKIVQALNPAMAITAHTLSQKAGGKGTIKGPLGSLVSAGANVAASVVPGGAAAQLARPQTLAAFGAAKAAIDAANTGKKLASTALAAKNLISAGNRAAGSLVYKVASKAAATTTTAQALAQQQAAKALAAASATTKAKIVASVPAIKKAAEIKAKLAQPQVKAALAKIKSQADSAKRALQQTAYDAKYATGAKKVEAQQSAKIVNLVAQNDARIALLAKMTAGGLPGILIDKDGRISRGKFQVRQLAPGAGQAILYRGPGQVMRGQFARVAGSEPVFMIGQGPSRISNDIIGTCFQVQNSRPGAKNLRISGAAPGLIGCDCGSEF